MSKARDAADKAPVAATLDGVETLNNKTIDDPIFTLDGSAGTAGQVPMSQGPGQPVAWGSISSNGASFSAIASGTLSNGCMVNLNDNGTVEMVKETTTVYPDSIPSGSAAAFNGSANFTMASIAFNRGVSNQFMLVYKDDGGGNTGKAVIGTISDSTITFGTEYQFTGSTTIESLDITHVPNTNDRFVIAWRGATERGKSIVAQISGSSISFGSEIDFSTSSTYGVSLASDPQNSGKVAVCFWDNNNGNYGTVCVGDVSGTNISWGAKTVFASVGCLGPTAITFDNYTSGKLIVMYRNNSNGYGYCIVGTVSGTSVSWGTAVAFYSAGNDLTEDYNNRGFAIASSHQTAGEFVVAYKNVTSNINVLRAATYSGTTITFGTAVTFDNTSIQAAIGLDMNKTIAGSYVMSYSTASATYARPFTISGTTITLGTAASLQSAASLYNRVVFDEQTARKFIGVYKNNGTSVGYAYTGTVGYSVVTNNLSATKFIGVCDGSYTDGQTATVQVKGGVNTSQSGLTVNATYYVQPNGTISTTPASPSVLAGRALAATKLLIGAT